MNLNPAARKGQRASREKTQVAPRALADRTNFQDFIDWVRNILAPSAPARLCHGKRLTGRWMCWAKWAGTVEFLKYTRTRAGVLADPVALQMPHALRMPGQPVANRAAPSQANSNRCSTDIFRQISVFFPSFFSLCFLHSARNFRVAWLRLDTERFLLRRPNQPLDNQPAFSYIPPSDT